MALVTLSLRSARNDGLAILYGTQTTLTGERDDTLVLPAGYGDVLLLDLNVFLTGVTRAAIATNVGVRAGIYANSYQDHFFAVPWVLAEATVLVATLDVDNVILWRQGEQLQVAYAAVESAGSYSWNAFARVRPLRNLGKDDRD